ncbi:MAG: ATP-binding protein [Acidobacteriota bacterium]
MRSPKGQSENLHEKLWLTALLLMTLAIVGGGLWLRDRRAGEIRRLVESDLAAIAKVKVQQIAAWRAERMAEAVLLSKSSAFREPFAEWQRTHSPQSAAVVLALYRRLEDRRRYREMTVVDARGTWLLGSGEPFALHEEERNALQRALRDQRPHLTDPYRRREDGAILLSVLAPLPRSAGAPGADPHALLLTMDAQADLYPIAQSWPTASPSGEFLLVGRRSDRVLLLCDTRHQPGMALSFAPSVARTELPGVLAVLGREGVAEGIDYRGVPVLAFLARIPDSPWFLVSKVDIAEALSTQRYESVVLLALLSAMLLTLAAGGGLVWQRRRHWRRLARSESLLREMGATARVGGWEVNPQTLEVRWTDEIYHIHELPLGHTPPLREAINYFHPDDRENLAGAIRRALEAGEPYDMEIRLITAKGRCLWTRAICKPIVAGGKTVLLRGVFQDIDTRKLAELELARHRDHLEDLVAQRTAELELAKAVAESASRAKSSFLANMSHEIRTPLNAILGFGQLLAHDPVLTPRQHEYLQAIARAGEHLLVLINDILDLAKIEAGRAQFMPGAFDLHACLDDLTAMFRMRCEAKSLSFEARVASEVPRFVETDEGKLRQILVNLLGNAAKFTSAGGVVLDASAERGASDNQWWVSIAVRDTGPGIDPEHLDTIFQAFGQAAGGRATGGTGLGLSIAQEFARLLGGDVGVDSRPGSGSVFTLTIPLVTAEPVSATKPIPARRVVGLANVTDPPRILIVDDRADNRIILHAMLTSVGFVTRQATDGHGGVALFDTWHPHAILMDMKMPGMSGYEATRRIKATERGKTTPIIAISASAFDFNQQEAFEAGADLFIGKPFRQAELLAKLGDALGLDYLYADAPDSGPPLDPSRDEEEQLQAALAILPPDLIEALRRAALAARYDELRALADAVEPVSRAGSLALRGFVERFDYPGLVTLLESGSHAHE